jgi:hypothetical protein
MRVPLISSVFVTFWATCLILSLAERIPVDKINDPLWKQVFEQLRAPLPPGWSDLLADDPPSSSQKHLDYGSKHPFELAQRRRRRLQLPDPENIALTYTNRDNYQPLRIKFLTDPLEARRGENVELDAFIDTVLEDVLPEVAHTWSGHLSVYPVQGSIMFDSNDDCYGIYGQDTFMAPTNVSDTDLVMIVSAKDTLTASGSNGDITVVQCTQERRALSTVCAQDQYDRPVISMMNFCVRNAEALQQISTTKTTLLATHEAAHALGFVFHLFKYFRNSTTGEPLTPRPFEPQAITCVDGSVRSTMFPSEVTTLQRGVTDKGLIYYDVVTPTVRTVARNHYNCSTLAGARLENQPNNVGACVGDHWDERVALSELMGSIYKRVSNAEIILSPLTLALFQDSGWYNVIYSNAQMSPFGHGSGCEFVDRDCIVNDQVPDYGRGVFCSTVNEFSSDGFISPKELVCDPTHTEFAACDLFDTDAVPADFQSLFPEDPVNYFSNPALSSIDIFADYCPLPIIPAPVDCTNAEVNYNPTYADESAGPDSRCIVAYFGENDVRVVQPACFPIVCDASQQKVQIGGQTCDFDFQELEIDTKTGSPARMICPRLTTICPELFCPSACSGRGECDWEATPRPKCNCFDPEDTSTACSGDDPTPSPTSPPVAAPTTTSAGTGALFVIGSISVILSHVVLLLAQ